MIKSNTVRGAVHPYPIRERLIMKYAVEVHMSITRTIYVDAFNLADARDEAANTLTLEDFEDVQYAAELTVGDAWTINELEEDFV